MTVENMNAQVWLNQDLYPFEKHYYNTSQGKMHYVDEGEGEVILFLHGTPTWSFLYSEQIMSLSKNYRCIAVDHIGFGLSDKPQEFSYHPEELNHHLEGLIDSLQLKDITLVVHDFGGPIGLPYAIDNPDNIKRLVLFNTWLWSTEENEDVQRIDKIVNSFLGRILYLNFNFSAGYLLKNSFHDKDKLMKEAKRHYKKVLPSKEERYGPYKIAQQLKGASDFYAQQWDKINRIKDKPTLILWGKEDDFIKPSYLEKWKATFTRLNITEMQCGHFPQEEETELVNQALSDFMNSLPVETTIKND